MKKIILIAFVFLSAMIKASSQELTAKEKAEGIAKDDLARPNMKGKKSMALLKKSRR